MKTTKYFRKRVETIVDKLYTLQEAIQEALDEYDEYESEHEELSDS